MTQTRRRKKVFIDRPWIDRVRILAGSADGARLSRHVDMPVVEPRADGVGE
jgi:hypothetical protein